MVYCDFTKDNYDFMIYMDAPGYFFLEVVFMVLRS